MSTKKDVLSYVQKARRLGRRFPSLKKYRRRRTLKPWEKAHIARLANINETMNLPVSERPEKYQQYIFPGDRIKTDAQYKRIARKLAPFDLGATQSLDKARKQRRKLKPWQKALITRKRNALPYTDQLAPLTRKEAEALPPEALRGDLKQGIAAVKLRQIEIPKAKISVDTKSHELIVRERVKKRGVRRKLLRETIYRPIEFNWEDDGEGEVHRKFKDAAQAAFDAGAREVFFWTVHGRAGSGARSIKQIDRMLNEQYLVYLAENEEEDQSTDWLLGIAVLYEG